MSHAEILAFVAEALRRRGRAALTVEAVHYVARQFLGSTTKPVEEIGPADVRDFLAGLCVRNVTPATFHAYARRLRHFFRALVEAGVVASDPTVGFKIPPPRRRPQLLLSRREIRRLLDAADNVRWLCSLAPGVPEALALRNRALIELLYGVGLRRSEASAILVGDPCLANRSILVRRVKRGPQASLPLPLPAIEPLRRYLAEGRPVLARQRKGTAGDHLLLTWKGTPLTGEGVYQAVKRIALWAGIEAKPHALRRSVATHFMQEGALVEVVRCFLGHARLDATEIYVQVDREDQRRAVEALELDVTPESRSLEVGR